MAELEELKVHNKAWQMLQDAKEKAALRSWEEWWNHIIRGMGPRTQAEAAADNVYATPFNFNNPSTYPTTASRSNSVTIAEGAIAIYAAPGQSEGAIGRAVRRELGDLLKEYA
jgi:hypothetical protein